MLPPAGRVVEYALSLWTKERLQSASTPLSEECHKVFVELGLNFSQGVIRLILGGR
ncbi:hypothetical protein EDC27_1212 [Desulfosoma caldarium]|uniref:Uncharacterized protein n=1 Tax=Desulfosoma caldarium TaxID=610254 RepID=A0A3N1V0Y5_9BACT|nr:hypothetical protein EDC27_1212 [Desulfosoma caldarium]